MLGKEPIEDPLRGVPLLPDTVSDDPLTRKEGTMNQPDTPDPQVHLASLRHKIDSLDWQLVAVIQERMQVCLEVADVKTTHNIPMMQPSRVNTVLERGRTAAREADLPEEYFVAIFTLIIDETCRQEDLRMASKRGN